MRLQIRRSTFETNSSTNHTLAIRRTDNSAADKLDRSRIWTVSVGSEPFSEIEKIIDHPVVNLGELTLETKLNILFWAAVSNCSTSDMLSAIDIIDRAAAKIGVKLEFSFSEAIKAVNEEYLPDYGVLAMAGSELVFYEERDIIDFLLSEDVWYTCWCDECCGEPSEEIEEIEARIESIPEDKRLVLRERM